MNLNLKNLGSSYVRFVGQHPSSWILILFLLLLPAPARSIAPEVIFPKLRPEISVNLSLGSPYPINDAAAAPETTATGIYIVDAKSMVPILTKNADRPISPASTTKIMTALVAMETQGFEVVEPKSDSAIGKTIHLKTGEQFTASDMMYGLLLESGNDVALALAQNYPGGYQAMVAAMNRKAKELGMDNTTYKNVSGIDQDGHLTTAHDLAMLAVYAMKQPQFRTIVGTKAKEIVSVDGRSRYKLQNTNKLLGVVEGVVGVKTGWTELAGESLVTYIERDDRQIATVVLGSQDRFGETASLINWVYENHRWETPQAGFEEF